MIFMEFLAFLILSGWNLALHICSSSMHSSWQEGDGCYPGSFIARLPFRLDVRAGFHWAL